ncbi:hypothetical protein AAHA92_20693 [Salvia divinorum]|uniref:Uncharacterized protein n=1 Tax=Salvia divinorum TaxID=28513 RepID=A0ABD1GKQ8_SALDI
MYIHLFSGLDAFKAPQVNLLFSPQPSACFHILDVPLLNSFTLAGDVPNRERWATFRDLLKVRYPGCPDAISPHWVLVLHWNHVFCRNHVQTQRCIHGKDRDQNSEQQGRR